MQAIAVGTIGISLGDFWNLTYREFLLILDRWRAKEDEKQQIEWNRIRWQTFCQVQAAGVKIKRQQELVRFEWDSKIQVNRPTMSDQMRIMEKYRIGKDLKLIN